MLIVICVDLVRMLKYGKSTHTKSYGGRINHRIEFEKAKNILSRANNGCADDVLIVICQPRSAQRSLPVVFLDALASLELVLSLTPSFLPLPFFGIAIYEISRM